MGDDLGTVASGQHIGHIGAQAPVDEYSATGFNGAVGNQIDVGADARGEAHQLTLDALVSIGDRMTLAR